MARSTWTSRSSICAHQENKDRHSVWREFKAMLGSSHPSICPENASLRLDKQGRVLMVMEA
jgi:hypothetical protein